MKLILCVLLLSVSVSHGITGGITATESYPFHAALYNNGTHTCGCTIINPHFVLTSAACLNETRSNELTILTGTNKLSTGGKTYEVEKIIIHPDYKWYYNEPNFAVLKMKSAIELDENTTTVVLSNEFPKIGSQAIGIGWGLVNIRDEYPDDLQQINVTVVKNQICNDKKICVESTVDKGLVSGDHGGPLLIDGKQVGIFSWGLYPMAFPYVYASISAYYNWILEQAAT